MKEDKIEKLIGEIYNEFSGKEWFELLGFDQRFYACQDEAMKRINARNVPKKVSSYKLASPVVACS